MAHKTGVSKGDLEVLRKLAARKAEIASDPVNLERKRLWYSHDAGTGGRPMVLIEPWAIRDEVLPLPDSTLQCKGDWARAAERSIRWELYNFDVLKDDHVVEPWMAANWKLNVSDYGVQAIQHSGDRDGHMGARRWDAPIRDLDKDFDKLHPRTYSVDRDATEAGIEKLESVFKGILPAKMQGGFWWTIGMTWPAIELIGLENLMLFMYDNPKGLHRLMKFLHDDHLAFAQWLEKEGLFSLNNINDYIGSGSMGYTRALPQPDWKPGDKVRMKDLWTLSESQETVGVGPDLFEEFIFPYQVDLIQRFGRCYYGCCEPVHNRWHVLKRIPNLARVSVSPWADEAFMARELGSKYVYSRKPNPSLISTEAFDETAIRADIRKTLDTAKGCRIELIMKDVHTLQNQPMRLPRWVEIAREEIDKG
jgi:hypothetical protein